jgi:hypothetical protein
MVAVYTIDTPTCLVPVVGVRASLVGAPAVTVNDADAPVRPAAVTVMVALPTVLGVRLDVALPPLAVTGDAGLNVPDTPLTAKLIAVVGEVTVFPLASWMVAV